MQILLKGHLPIISNLQIICRFICPHARLMSLVGQEDDLRRQETYFSTEGIFSALC